MTTILDFYAKNLPTPSGHTYNDILTTWDFEKFESVHDYIQWLFPLDKPSFAQPQSPVLTQDEIAHFNSNVKLQNRLLQSFDLMLYFYGFELNETNGVEITRGVNWEARSKQWLMPKNHNFLRITRILKSLMLLGLTEYAKAFYEALGVVYVVYQDAYEIIGNRTLGFWKNAVS